MRIYYNKYTHLKLLNVNRVTAMLVLILLIRLSCFAQANTKLLDQYGFKQINSDGIRMLVCQKDTTPKPTIIFISGSGFNPFFINGNFYGFPFNIYPYTSNFNFVMLQKPGIPFSDDSTNNKYLNESYPTGFYKDSTENFPPELVDNNNYGFYINEHLKLIDYLQQQPWVKKGKIILVGHSQGAFIAAGLASKCKAMSKVILMSPGSIFNRFHEFVRQYRTEANYGQISHSRAQEKIDSVYARQKDLLQNKDKRDKKFDAFSYQSYFSFDYPSFKDKLLKLKQQTLLLYGTASLQDADCDYLPLILQEHNKQNISIHPYQNYDHNYFENIFDEKGNFKEQKFHWDDVMKDVMDWIKSN